MKSITPVVSVILLVLITVVASMSAFFFINSSVSDLQSQGSLDTNPVMDNSRLNLVSITGSKAIVRNDGSSPVTQAIVFVNGELLNFELDPPILPGQLREINYTARKAGEDLEIKIIYNSGKTVTDFSLASVNTNASGFTDINVPLNPPIVVYCSGDTVNFENNIDFTDSSSLVCGCSNYSYAPNLILNGDFETGDFSHWELEEADLPYNSISISDEFKLGYYSAKIASTNDTFNPANIPHINSENITNTNYLSFSINGSVNTTVDNSFALIIVRFGEYAINYIMYNGTWNGPFECDTNVSDDTYVYCIQNLNDFEFNEVVVHPISDFEDNMAANVNNYENLTLTFGVGAGSTAYFDNIRINESFEGKYCDSDYDNLADGICSTGTCTSYCGDDTCQAWENEVTCFADCDNTVYCSGEVVNFEDNISFVDSSSLVCGCSNYSYAPNLVLNGDFETGDFSHWELEEADLPYNSISISDEFKLGYYSAKIASTNDTFNPANMPHINSENIINTNYLSFSINGSVNTTMNNSYALLIVRFSEDYAINYVMYNATWEGPFECNMNIENETYLYCIEGLNDFEFNEVVVHPISDFEDNMIANVNNYEEVRLTFGVGPGSIAYFDNIRINESFEGKYCDSDYDNLADGICSTGTCTDGYCGDGNCSIIEENSNCPQDCSLGWSDNIRLTFTTNDSESPKIAFNGDNIHVIWCEQLYEFDSEIYYKNSSDNGVTWSDNVNLTNNLNDSRNPEIAINGDNIYLVWTQELSDGSTEIYYKNSTDNGVTWGTDFRLTYNSSSSFNPNIAVNGSNIHVVWDDYRNGNAEIYYKNSSDNGATWSSDVRLTNAIDYSYFSKIAVNENNIHIVWTDERDGEAEIYYINSSDNGATWGTGIELINNDTLEDYYPDIAVSGDDVHVVWDEGNRLVWENGNLSEGSIGIYYIHSSDNGATWGEKVRLTNESLISAYSNIVVNEDNIHVVWLVFDGSQIDSYYINSSDNGVNWGDVVRLTNNAATQIPEIGINNENVYVIWNDNSNSNNDEIYYKYK
jgi:flagellin-like protein